MNKHEPVLPRSIDSSDILVGTGPVKYAVVLQSGYVVAIAGEDDYSKSCRHDVMSPADGSFSCSRFEGHRGPHVAVEFSEDDVMEGHILAITDHV